MPSTARREGSLLSRLTFNPVCSHIPWCTELVNGMQSYVCKGQLELCFSPFMGGCHCSHPVEHPQPLSSFSSSFLCYILALRGMPSQPVSDLHPIISQHLNSLCWFLPVLFPVPTPLLWAVMDCSTPLLAAVTVLG